MSGAGRKLPPWLKRPWPAGHSFQHTRETLDALGLQTICTHANCPNRGECWGRGTATVLILGNVCTRNCRFCSVATGRPAPPDPTEPARLAEMAQQMNLRYLVITSVNRDDLPDGGAGHFRDCIQGVRRQCPAMQFEILTPDFRGCQEQALNILADALPFVFAHNVETVPSLYPTARAGGDYERSLRLLRLAKERYPRTEDRRRRTEDKGQKTEDRGLKTEDGRQKAGDSAVLRSPSSVLRSLVATKSSLMLGLGERDEEVEQVLRDLRGAGCERVTIGQYLRPARDALPVVEYIRPEKFDWWRQRALEIGFPWVLSAPFARSSYCAEQGNAR
jgi:lipoic acid synthetase